MAFLTSATATATVAQNTNSVAITGMDLNQVQPGMALYLGARDRAKGDGLIIAAVTPTGSSGGTIVLIGSVDAPYTNAAFLIDTIAYVGAGAVLQLEADYQVLNALRTFGGTNTNLAGGNRQLWLDKKLASNVSYLALAIGGVMYGRLEQRTFTYTPSGGTTTTTEAISLRTSADGTILTDAIMVDTATGGVDVQVASSTMVAAALVDLSSAPTGKVTITNSGGSPVSVSSFGPGKHKVREIHIQDDGVTLVNSASLVLPTVGNVLAKAGDMLRVTSNDAGVWRVRSYSRADGSPLMSANNLRQFLSLSVGTDVQAYDDDLAAIAALTTRAFGRSLLTVQDASAGRTLLGLSSTGAVSSRRRTRNGDFSINQRGVSGTVSLSAYTHGHDGWKAGAGGCTYTFASSGSGTSLNVSAGTIAQVIEGGLYVPEGGSYTLSWAGTAQGRVNNGAYGTSPLTVTGIGAGANVTVEFSTGTLGFVQFEPGASATPFEYRDDELRRCQRYFVKTFPQGVAPGAAGGAGAGATFAVNAFGFYSGFQRFPVTMRAPPSVAPWNHATGAIGTWRFFFGSTPADRPVSFVSTSNDGWEPAGNGNWVQGEYTYPHYTASAEL